MVGIAASAVEVCEMSKIRRSKTNTTYFYDIEPYIKNNRMKFHKKSRGDKK